MSKFSHMSVGAHKNRPKHHGPPAMFPLSPSFFFPKWHQLGMQEGKMFLPNPNSETKTGNPAVLKGKLPAARGCKEQPSPSSSDTQSTEYPRSIRDLLDFRFHFSLLSAITTEKGPRLGSGHYLLSFDGTFAFP